MGAPQIIWICIAGINVLAEAYWHGKPQKSKHNIWSTLISAGLTVGLLIWGGFFR